MRRTLLSVCLATATLGVVVGCTPSTPSSSAAVEPAAPAPTTEATPPAASDDAHAFQIGALQAFALKDGDVHVPNDNTTFGLGQPVADSTALLTAANLPTDTLHLSIQPLLVRSADKVLLFDTGAAGVSFAQAGRLPTALADAGVAPAQVTDIFISHAHGDHVGGLLDAQGALAFPNASVHISQAEWAALQADTDQAKLVAAVTPKVATFAPGAVLIPDVVTAVDVAGHTAGHSAYDISDGGQHLLYVGDSMHHHVLSLQRPDWSLLWDGNADVAKASRRALLQRAAAQDLRLYAVHFPYPGLGHVKADGEGFVWVPEG